MENPADRRWCISPHSHVAIRYWDGEYVVHHALSNDTHRLSATAGHLLERLARDGELEEGMLAAAVAAEPSEINAILSALAELDFVEWR
jgi:PqqD family protein of HPr-rel-A system